MGSWEDGFAAGWKAAQAGVDDTAQIYGVKSITAGKRPAAQKPKQKPSAWNNYVAKKSQMPRYKYKTTRGKKKKGMVNLKSIAAAWNNLTAGQKKKWA